MSPLDDSEMNLMCHILMDDSHWLDSYQESVLSREVKIKDAGLAAVSNQAISTTSPSSCFPLESRQSAETHLIRTNSNQDFHASMEIVAGRGLQRSKSTESLRSTGFGRRIITAPLSVVDQLPGPEFVAGTNSVIAAESMRMIAAVGSLHRTGSLGSAHQFVEGRRNPSLPHGT
jgi:hypothetical protein